MGQGKGTEGINNDKGSDKKKHNESGGAAKNPVFRGVNIAIGIRGEHSLRSTPGVGVLEIYGALKLILAKMEKELLGQ